MCLDSGGNRLPSAHVFSNLSSDSKNPGLQAGSESRALRATTNGHAQSGYSPHQTSDLILSIYISLCVANLTVTRTYIGTIQNGRRYRGLTRYICSTRWLSLIGFATDPTVFG